MVRLLRAVGRVILAEQQLPLRQAPNMGRDIPVGVVTASKNRPDFAVRRLWRAAHRKTTGKSGFCTHFRLNLHAGKRARGKQGQCSPKTSSSV
jgi:hypothetical protein